MYKNKRLLEINDNKEIKTEYENKSVKGRAKEEQMLQITKNNINRNNKKLMFKVIADRFDIMTM
ncbi:hypothetical protein C1645_832688 [Glomus cerebriforme]|uniref:Uncharacterized protein n=1 Tax=Glomus cerebriforme TaxID=658196 RepID=A0A397SJ48_9GLOM|nr:hypothetical protein C1645_832688 [Glomus cerebriforme]